MDHPSYNWRKFLSIGPILGLSCALAGHAQSLPAGAGEAAFQRTCSACHSITVVTAHRLSHAGWESVVDNMISRGATATPDEQEQIVSYLTANFGSSAAATENAAPGAASVPAQTAPAPVLDNSQVIQAKELIRSSGCLSCHRIDGKGSFAGPYLGDVGANYTAEQIRASLVAPSRELAPQNRMVRLVTRAGKLVVGKLLNQDGFSVQLIDASGHLLSFERTTLQNVTIVTVNSMPSYTSKLAPSDLSLLVQYLEIRTGQSQN